MTWPGDSARVFTRSLGNSAVASAAIGSGPVKGPNAIAHHTVRVDLAGLQRKRRGSLIIAAGEYSGKASPPRSPSEPNV
jgi:hypothetical protein